jgi:PQQ-dependent catabolism-associated CXXCW motif protein
MLSRLAASLVISLGLGATSLAALGADYANESKDFGVSEMKSPKGPPYNTATPLKVPGGTTVTTDELKEMLAKEPQPVLIDALASSEMIESAHGLGSAIGEQRMFGRDRSMFPKALETLTAGDKARALVFYCRGSSCWHSYNASLHAIDAGYTNVVWYRGGLDAWKASGGKTVPYTTSPAAK